MMNSGDALRERAHRLGIETGYWDISGQWHNTSEEVLERIAEMRQSARAERSDRVSAGCVVKPVAASIELLLASHWLKDPDAAQVDNLFWEYIAESGESLGRGQVSAYRSEQGSLACTLPGVAIAGYHCLQLQADGLLTAIEVPLIVYPDQCFMPSIEQRHLGVSAQVYSLCRSESQALGTFGDLYELCVQAKAQGVSFVGVNPLHALAAGEASPYAPTSRIAYNTLYVDRRLALQKLFAEDGVEALSPAARYINYPRCYATQELFLSSLFARFNQGDGVLPGMREHFETFYETAPRELWLFAVYEALQARFRRENPECHGWLQWPVEYRRCNAPAVMQFVERGQFEIRYRLFGQWLAQLQLQECAAVFESDERTLGLYTDIALGVQANSADAWIFQESYAFGASMGAPPDGFNPSGQDWGLPPLDPDRIREIGYTPFILALREAMRFAGAVRIDHVMSLYRLFWVLPNKTGGTYVRYAVEELFGIVALESQRNRCVVVGEDLGTVPDEVRDAMRRFAVLSYKVMIFMRGGDGGFIAATDYPQAALVTASTHDLPTIVGFMTGRDIDVRRELELHDEQTLRHLGDERGWAKQKLAELFSRVTARRECESESEYWLRAASEFVASTPSMLCAVQLEDLLLEEQQVNIPGTTVEHPNWSRKLAQPYSVVLAEPRVRGLLAEMVQKLQRV